MLSNNADISLTNTAGNILVGDVEVNGQFFEAIRTVASGDGSVTLKVTDPDGRIILDAAETSAPVRSGGSQTYDGAVELLHDTVLETLESGANVSFLATVDTADGAAEARSLEVLASGTTTFGGSLGARYPGAALASLRTDALGATQINGASVTTEGGQSYGDAVTLGGDTTFTANTLPPIESTEETEGVEGREGSIFFGSTLDGGGATVNADAKVSFAGDVGATTALSHLTVHSDLMEDPPEDAAFGIDFTGAQRVVTGSDGILLNHNRNEALRDPDQATLYSRSGPLSFETTGGAFETGRYEKLSVVGALGIEADSASVGDLSAFAIDVVADSITLLARNEGGAGEVADYVANSLSFSTVPEIEGTGAAAPVVTLASADGAVHTPGSLSDFELRLARPNGSRVSSADFLSGDTVLDLMATGPIALGDPASEVVRVRDWEPVRPFREAQIGEGEPAQPAQVSAEEVLAFLECAPLAAGGESPGHCAGAGLPQVAAGRGAPSHSMLETPRALEVAALYRQLIRGAQPSAGVRDALRDAVERYRQRFQTAEVDGAALRTHLERSSDRMDQRALEHLNRLTAFSAQLRLLGLADEDFQAVQHAVLEEFAGRVGAPGLSAEALAEAVDASFPGVFP